MGGGSSDTTSSGSRGGEEERRDKKSSHKHKSKSKHKHKKDKKDKHKKRHRSPSPDLARLEAAKAFLQEALKRGGGEEAAAAAAAVFAAEQRAAAGGGGGGGGGSEREREHKRERERAKRQKRAAKPKPAGVADIDEGDYFSRAPEFTSWLLEDRGLYFNELEGDRARALFTEFVEDWNGGHLALKYYQGLVQAPTKRTTHQWGLAGRAGGSGSAPRAGGGGVAALVADQRQQQVEARQAEAAERRKWKGEQKELLDELLPKATGREAAVEKRIARREAAKAREDSPELMRVTGGGDVMGGGDSFAAAKAREAAANARRQARDAARREELAHKLSAAQAAEEAKMAQFRALLQHGPISIPKRQ